MYKITLVFKSNGEEYCEHYSVNEFLDDSLEDANDIAFSNTGFSLESWTLIADFQEDGKLYYLYPIDEDETTKYALKILKL